MFCGALSSVGFMSGYGGWPRVELERLAQSRGDLQHPFPLPSEHGGCWLVLGCFFDFHFFPLALYVVFFD